MHSEFSQWWLSSFQHPKQVKILSTFVQRYQTHRSFCTFLTLKKNIYFSSIGCTLFLPQCVTVLIALDKFDLILSLNAKKQTFQLVSKINITNIQQKILYKIISIFLLSIKVQLNKTNLWVVVGVEGIFDVINRVLALGFTLYFSFLHRTYFFSSYKVQSDATDDSNKQYCCSNFHSASLSWTSSMQQHLICRTALEKVDKNVHVNLLKTQHLLHIFEYPCSCIH